MSNAAPDWWRTFFSGSAVEFWLNSTPEEQTRMEADFIQQRLGVAAPARVLDVPCGGGRHSLALAARGYRMTAVDLSPEFLATARASAETRSVEVDWQHREMRDLPWKEEFDGAFCFGNSFGYDVDEGNAAFLEAVSAALKAGGRFLLDTGYVAEALLPTLQERAWYPTGDILTLADRRYDHVHSRLNVDYIWIRDGKMEKRSASSRLYTYRELARLFEDAGFTDVEGFGSLAGEPFRFGSRRLLMTGSKKAK
jgi:SAM-dependent methyltransferase